MGKRFWGWLIWFVFLFILNFTIPFAVLGGVPKFRGSFLFWLIWGAVVIASMFMIFMRWSDPEEDSRE